jgi:hypothetical protein
MAWSLTAAGHCAAELEHELAAAVSEVLSRPEFGTAASQLGGEAVNGPVHDAPAAPADDPAADE